MSVVEEIIKTIDYALDKRLPALKRDVTYTCKVDTVGNNNTYKLSYKGSYYIVTTKNIILKEMDTVHLVIPNGDENNKYILEDIIVGCSKFKSI